MELVVARDNMRTALKRVKGNKGSPGIDGMTVNELPTYLKAAWTGIREQLLAGTYEPTAVLRKEIPKSGGGVRKLGSARRPAVAAPCERAPRRGRQGIGETWTRVRPLRRRLQRIRWVATSG